VRLANADQGEIQLVRGGRGGGRAGSARVAHPSYSYRGRYGYGGAHVRGGYGGYRGYGGYGGYRGYGGYGGYGRGWGYGYGLRNWGYRGWAPGWRGGYFIGGGWYGGVYLNAPWYYASPFYYAPFYASYWPGLYYYPYAFAYPTALVTVPTIEQVAPQLNPEALQQARQRALPEGVLPARAAISGYAYFPKLPPDVRQVRLVWRPATPQGQPLPPVSVALAR
jgi:hypothetical protein